MRAVIFDLDGTLVDSLGDIAHLMNAALAEHGLPTHAVERYQDFVGSGVTVLAERATAGVEADVGALVRAFHDRYRAQPVRETRLFDGVLEMLGELQRREMRLAILSNKPHELTTAIVGELFEDSLFAEVWGQKNDYPRKPDPTSALAIAKLIDVAPSACTFVGDTDVDILTATRCAMRAVGVSWGFRPARELIDAGADAIVDHPTELLDVVGSTTANR